MNAIRRILLSSAILLLPTICRAQSENPLQLTMPKECYAVVGVEMNIYFDNVVLTKTPEKYRFQVTCDIGATESRRWTVTPTANAVGHHKLTVTVRERGTEKKLGSATTSLRVLAADAGSMSLSSLSVFQVLR